MTEGMNKAPLFLGSSWSYFCFVYDTFYWENVYKICLLLLRVADYGPLSRWKGILVQFNI